MSERTPAAFAVLASSGNAIRIWWSGLERERAERVASEDFNRPLVELYTGETLRELEKQLAEAKKAAEFNFEQYQDAGRLLFEAAEQRDHLFGVMKKAVAQLDSLSGEIVCEYEGDKALVEEMRAAIAAVERAAARTGTLHSLTINGVEAVDDVVTKPADPDADGWIEWNGGECPVPEGTLVDVKFRNGGSPHFGIIPGEEWDWSHGDCHGFDIVAYRVGQGGACADHRPVTQHTGDGTPVEFCPECGRNEVVGFPVESEGGEP